MTEVHQDVDTGATLSPLVTQAADTAVVQATRNTLWGNGYRPLPVYSWDFKEPSPPPGKKPLPPRAGKAPLGLGWQTGARQDPPECITLASVVLWATNTGILCDGLRAIDFDIDDEGLCLSLVGMALRRFGDTLWRRRENSPRSLLVYRAAEGEPPKVVITGAAHSKDHACKIEVLGKGQQFVAYGRHPSGADLRWPVFAKNTQDHFVERGPAELPLADVPQISEQQLAEFLTEAAKLIDAVPPGTPRAPRQPSNGQDHDGPPTAEVADIAAALAVIPNAGPPDWEAWNNV
jgi:hypothetical protein